MSQLRLKKLSTTKLDVANRQTTQPSPARLGARAGRQPQHEASTQPTLDDRIRSHAIGNYKALCAIDSEHARKRPQQNLKWRSQTRRNSKIKSDRHKSGKQRRRPPTPYTPRPLQVLLKAREANGALTDSVNPSLRFCSKPASSCTATSICCPTIRRTACAQSSCAGACTGCSCTGRRR